MRNQKNEQRGPGSKSRRDEAGSESPPVREPLEPYIGGTAINQRRAHSGYRIQNVEFVQSFGLPQASPAKSTKHGCKRYELARAEPVHQPARERHHPSFKRDEECES